MLLPGPADTSRPSTPERAGSAHHYSFIVTALVVFLVGLFFVRQPVAGYVTQAMLARRVVGGSGDSVLQAADTAALEALLMQGDALRRAVRDAKLAPADDRDLLVMDTLIESLRQQLRLTVLSDSPRDVRIRLEYTGPDRESGRLLVDSICRQFIEASALSIANDRPRDVQPEQRTDRWRVREARHYERKVRQQLDTHLDEFFQALEVQAAGAWDATAVSKPAPTVPNPEWATQQRHVQQLATDRGKLLGKLTAAHPQVRELDTEIALAERRLALTPQTVPTDAEASDSRSDDVRWQRGELQTVVDEFRRLKMQHEQTVAQREQAEEAVSAEEANAPQQPRAATVWMMQPAYIASQIGGGPSPGRMAMLVMISLVSGLVVARWIDSRADFPTFRSRTAAEQVSAKPAVADLSDGSHAADENHYRRRAS